MDRLTKFIHRRGIHIYTIPIKFIEKQIYSIEGDGDLISSQTKYKVYKRVKCRHCNKRKNKHYQTVTRTWS